MKKVHLLIITDGAYTIEKQVFSTHDKAVKYLAQWCRAQWAEQGDDGEGREPLEGEDRLAIRSYFDYWSEEQKYDLEEVAIDGAF